MAIVIRKEFYDVEYTNVYKITPLGDIHLGAAACWEERFKEVVDTIAKEDNHYWIGMGDYAEWINMKDPRFSVESLADWITRQDLVDISKAQMNRLKMYLGPIAHKCLGLVKGNHELKITQHTERDVFGMLVDFIKGEAGMPIEEKLGIGFYGWIRLMFYHNKEHTRNQVRKVTLNLHHGFTAGRLAGAKALNMQRWLWSHEADLVIFGHSHTDNIQPEAVEALDRNDNIITTVRKGMYSGTFLKTVNEKGPSTYSEEKGYLPLPAGLIPEIEIRPSSSLEKRVRITT